MILTDGFSEEKLYELDGILKNGGSKEIQKVKSNERYRSNNGSIEVIEV